MDKELPKAALFFILQVGFRINLPTFAEQDLNFNNSKL